MSYVFLNPLKHLDRDEVWQESQCSVRIEWSQCNYGGQRAWFRYPVEGRNRRVVKVATPSFDLIVMSSSLRKVLKTYDCVAEVSMRASVSEAKRGLPTNVNEATLMISAIQDSNFFMLIFLFRLILLVISRDALDQWLSLRFITPVF